MNYLHMTLYDTTVGFITRYTKWQDYDDNDDNEVEFILKWLVRNWRPEKVALVSHRYISQELYELYRERFPMGEIQDFEINEPNLEHLGDDL